MSSVFNMVGGGSGGAGGILVVNAVAGATVRAVNEELGEIKTRIADADGIATFKGLASGTWKLTMTLDEQTSSAVEVEIVTDYTQALAFFKAYINATYPSGSVCTCTDGTTTFTAPDTSGSVTFTVPNAGTWTVTATDGTDTVSETVEITAEGQSESVELRYRLYLIKDGVALVTLTNLELLTVTASSVSLGGAHEAGFRTTNKLSCDDWNKVCVEMKIGTVAHDYPIHLVVSDYTGNSNYYKSDPAKTPDNPVAYSRVRPVTANSNLNMSVNLSSVTGSHYIGIGTGYIAINIINMWFE